MGLLEMNRLWLYKITFLKDIYEYANTIDAHGHSHGHYANVMRAFVHEIARAVHTALFAQGEKFGKYQELYVLNQGVVSRKGTVYTSGAVWGIDFLLSDASLQLSPRSLSLTYVTLIALSRDDFMSVMGNYAEECPEIQSRVRRHVCWLAAQRG